MPDPDKDEVVAVFYSFYDSNFQRIDHDSLFNCESGIIALNNTQLSPLRLRNWTMDAVASELDLLNSVVDIVQSFDPDIITGWEVQASSWGYLNARARSYGESRKSAVLVINNINIVWACRTRLL
jgi:DNA polymerase zeta